MKTAFLLVLLCLTGLPGAGICAPLPTPPAYEMTQAEYDATVKHRNELAAARTAKEAAQKGQLETTGKAEDANAKLVPELQDNIKLLKSDISSLKRQLFIARWKWAIIGAFIGIVVAIGALLFTKAAVVVTSIAAKVGIKAAIA